MTFYMLSPSWGQVSSALRGPKVWEVWGDSHLSGVPLSPTWHHACVDTTFFHIATAGAGGPGLHWRAGFVLHHPPSVP